jgi:hypothetical protein
MIVLVVLMILTWPVAVYVTSAKIRKLSVRDYRYHVIASLVLSLWLQFMLADAFAMKQNEWPWIEIVFPLVWIGAGVVFVAANIVGNE